MNPASLRIADTTREEREKIVAESIGNTAGLCDGCSPGIIEMYNDYIEGKRELGMLYNNFNTSLITSESVQGIIESAIEYTTNFDLLTPPYDDVKMVSVGEMRNDMDKKTLVTGKRLGFRFQADTD